MAIQQCLLPGSCLGYRRKEEIGGVNRGEKGLSIVILKPSKASPYHLGHAQQAHSSTNGVPGSTADPWMPLPPTLQIPRARSPALNVMFISFTPVLLGTHVCLQNSSTLSAQ